jgi:hypothetical protein
MGLKEQEGTGMPEQVDIHRQARLTLYDPLNLISQLRGSLGSALSRREQIRGAIRHEQRSEIVPIKIEKAGDIRRQFEFERLLVLDLSGGNDEVNDGITSRTTAHEVLIEPESSEVFGA